MKKNTLESELNTYFHNIRLLFPVYAGAERRYVRALQREIRMYMDDHGDTVSFSDIIERFGSAKDVVKAYLNAMENEELYRYLSRWKRVRRLLAALLLVAFVISAAKIGIVFYNFYTGLDSIAVTEETVIE